MDTYVKTALIRHVLSRSDYPWDWTKLSVHNNMSSEFIKHFKDKPLNYDGIIRNPKFKLSWVIDNIDCSWNWDLISDHVKIMDVVNHPECPWNYDVLSLSNNISSTDMVKNPNLPWKLNLFGFHQIDMECIAFLRTFRHKLTRNDMIDHTKHADWSIIKLNLDIPWVPEHIQFKAGDMETQSDVNAMEWFFTRGGINMTTTSSIANIDIILENQHLPWDWSIVSIRDDLTYTLSQQCTDKLNVNLAPLEDESTMVRRWVACKTIQRYWKIAVSNPAYQVCVRRLMREFNILTNVNE